MNKKEIRDLVSTAIILVDTREQKNEHITKYFEKCNIAYKWQCLKQGDYSVMIPANEKYGIEKDLYFDRDIMIERKASLVELSGNFTRGRERFKREMTNAPQSKILLVEDSNYRDIAIGNYRTEFDKVAYIASLHSFWIKYDLPTIFIDKRCSGFFIAQHFKYYLINYFTNLQD